jgi:hypothetical protein
VAILSHEVALGLRDEKTLALIDSQVQGGSGSGSSSSSSSSSSTHGNGAANNSSGQGNSTIHGNGNHNSADVLRSRSSNANSNGNNGSSNNGDGGSRDDYGQCCKQLTRYELGKHGEFDLPANLESPDFLASGGFGTVATCIPKDQWLRREG